METSASTGLQEEKIELVRENGHQIVLLPEHFQFDTEEVFIRRRGTEIVISPRPATPAEYIEFGAVASPEFMENVDDLGGKSDLL